jgi:hypothetical protein
MGMRSPAEDQESAPALFAFVARRRDVLEVHAAGALQQVARGGQEEVYLVLDGELTLLVEGAEEVLGPDRLVRIGPSVRRQLVNAGPRRLVLLALGGSGDHEGRDGLARASWEDDSPGRPPQEIPLPEDLPSG